ncbi:MAG: CaiB/BaiF CoA transferase family protein [Hyphomicrobiaceae bacterium]
MTGRFDTFRQRRLTFQFNDMGEALTASAVLEKDMSKSKSSVRQSGPLVGLKVLDLSTIISAPLAATLLADYGAEVLKVELPRVGDSVRSYPPLKDDVSLWWKVANRNKKFITLDVRHPDGLALMKKLIGKFDVLVENFRPGTLDKWGLSKDILWELQPRLIILRCTAFGQTGPYRNRPGFTRVFEAMSGVAYITGEPDHEPMHMGFHIGDAVGGVFGALGILTALWKRARDPKQPGEEIDLSLTEAMLRLVDFLPIEYDQLGLVRERIGNSNHFSAPTLVCKTCNGQWVSMSGGNTAVFQNNCRAIGREDMINDTRFITSTARAENKDLLNRIFRDWIGERHFSEVISRFEAAGGALAPVYSIDQIFTDPQMIAREAIVSVPDDDFGEVRMQNVVPRFTREPGAVRSSAGRLGSDNDEIYGTWLGLSVEERERLSEEKII